MARELRLQDPGEGIHEAEILEVLVSVGDHVDDGDPVLVVETDKASSDVASPYSGEITAIEVEVGDVVTVGDVLMHVDGEDDDTDTEDTGDTEDTEDTDEADTEAEETDETDETDDEDEADTEDEGTTDTTDTAEDEGTTDTTEDTTDRPVPASPATRRLARELDVDLRSVTPSGPHGRVTADDVRSAAEEPETREEEEGREEEGREEDERREAPVEPEDDTERIPVRGVRRTIARRMAASWKAIARVTHHDEADVTELERLRRRQQADLPADADLGLLPLTMKAVASTLRDFPRLNAHFDDDADEIVLHRHVHLGIAVDTDDGLIVPVVRDVDTTPVTELAKSVPELVERTRGRDLSRAEMRGATFTITNVGPLGGTGFTPMVDAPQVAILGMARATLRQVVVDGDIDDDPGDLRVEARLLLPLSLSFDHRVADGADAARFVTELAARLADPQRLLLTL